MSELNTSSSPQHHDAHPTDDHFIGGRDEQQRLQTLGSRQSMSLRGANAQTKALMNRVATGRATEADHAEFETFMRGGYTYNFPTFASATLASCVPSVEPRLSPPSNGITQDHQADLMLSEQENKRWLKENVQLPERYSNFSSSPQSRSPALRIEGRSKPQSALPLSVTHPGMKNALNDYHSELRFLGQLVRKNATGISQGQDLVDGRSSSISQASVEDSPGLPGENEPAMPWMDHPGSLNCPPYSHYGDQMQQYDCPTSQNYLETLRKLEQQNERRLELGLAESDAVRFLKATESAAEAYCKPFCDFLTDNPTVFHAVDSTKKDLRSAGWTELSERDVWNIQPSGRYFVVRNGSSLIAFVVGANYVSGNGAAILAGHVDALCAKLKPVSEVPNKAGYLQLGVAPYAGAMSETWWDRDLGIGGRVLVKEGDKIVTKLVKLDWPIARIPSLAPHFGAAAQGPFNKETQMTPIIGLERVDSSDPIFAASADAKFVTKQPPALVRAIGNQLGLSEKTYSKIINWELELFDVQPATVGGLNKEFIYAGRIDDKLCSWAAMQALTSSSVNDTHASSLIKVVAWFDNEEIGSQLRQGARSNFLPQVLERVVGSLAKNHPGPDLMGRTYANSFIVSSDVTHAVNPNFEEAYLRSASPRLNTGLVVCADANGHMTTDAVSTAILQRCADGVGAKLQVFQIRNDSRSGGTVGPVLSSMTGIRAIDAGMPQLSMHSIRATTGSLDPGLGVIMFTGFLNGFERVDKEFRS